MISPAPTPKAVKPRMRSPSASTNAFMKPRVSPRVRARRFASIGTLNKRYAMLPAVASRSFSPTRASSGSVKRQYGTCLPVVVRRPPASPECTTRKSSTLMCVNCGLPATSPMAHWAEGGPLGTFYAQDGGPLGIWRRWAPQAQGQSMKGGHFFPEENPDETVVFLKWFLSS